MHLVELKLEEDYQDLSLLRKTKKERANDPLVSFDDMKKEFSVKNNPTDLISQMIEKL